MKKYELFQSQNSMSPVCFILHKRRQSCLKPHFLSLVSPNNNRYKFSFEIFCFAPESLMMNFYRKPKCSHITTLSKTSL